MRRGKAIRCILLLAAIVSACDVGFWLARQSTAETTQGRLDECLGQPARDVVQQLRLGDAEWHWTDEPPGVLRGVSYSPVDGRQVSVYIAEGEPLFRKFSARRKWDYEAFLDCRIGGIQYESEEIRLDLGPAVPWQFRGP